MSWDEWRWWWGNREQMLRERSEELAAEAASQAAAQRRLASQLSTLEGSLERRVSRMAAAFDAFVELSDMRMDLALHAPAARARLQVHRLLDAVGAVGAVDAVGAVGALGVGSPGAPPLPPDDVPGYWLVPAAEALVARLAGQPDAAGSALERAQGRDDVRARRFTLYTFAVIGRGGEVVDGLSAELDAIDPVVVSPSDRAIWLAALDGLFGSSGRAATTDRLTELAVRVAAGSTQPQGTPAWAPGSEAAESLAPWVEAAFRLARGPKASPAVESARVLEALAAHAESALSQGGGDAALSSSPEAAFESHRIVLERLLVELVDEGSPEEAALLQRAGELRRVIDPDDPGPAGPPPGELPAGGTLEDLLRADAFSTVADASVSRAVALRAAQPWLARLFDDLLARAQVPAPAQAEVRIAGVTVTVDGRPAGPGPLAEIEQRVRAAGPSPVNRTLAVVAIVAGVVLAFIGFLTVGALVVLGVALAGVGAYLLFRSVAVEREVTSRVAYELSDATRRLDRANQQLVTDQGEAAQAAETASGARSRLRELLA